ncbi:MAG: hypothetical protein JNL92_13050 [Opitutaceae bacterium]|nr:hypothetical protein [Opitutaceae bacterium]
MRDESDPPRKLYRLKAPEFEAVNAPTDLPPRDATPTSVQGHLRAANGAPVSPSPASAVPKPDNDVQALLRDEAARRRAAGGDAIVPTPRRRSRRARDFWLLLLTANGFFAFAAFGPYRNTMTFTYGVAGMIFSTISLVWVMWFVMDDY